MFEVNLVPDVKNEMIKALKVRNLILFVCLIVSAVAVGVVLVLFSIKGGQDFAISQKDNEIKSLADQLANYEGLDQFLTIQDQLGKISSLTENKQAASRVFSMLGAMLPQGADKVTLSSLNVELRGETEQPVLTMEGQADAGTSPMIDYRVLEAFKKNVGMINYDYGHYVDKDGNTIPTACIEETDGNGVALVEDGNFYVNWLKGVKNCDPARDDSETEAETTEDGDGTGDSSNEAEQRDESEVVKIYRTPQFKTWYKDGNMTLEGEISGVEHFVSECKTYTGTESNGNVRWTSDNTCLAAEGGLTVTESSNAKDDSDNLVLRFSATMEVDPVVFSYNNQFMMITGPTGVQNVTDSYVQIEGMFAKRAQDCKADDVTCQDAENAGRSN